jgi:RNA recognition motif-containing protein
MSLDSNASGGGNPHGCFSANTPGLWQQSQRLGGASMPQRLPQSAPQTQSTPLTFETTLQKDLLACTVYLTKLPGGLTDAKIRRLISHFGEFNKVRMYKEKTPPALRGGPGQPPPSQHNRGCFGFVEYAQPSSAKAVIDYFRNASMTSNTPFHFLIGGDLTTAFTLDEITPLTFTRASYAKSAIHDQHPKDAIFEPISAGAAAGGAQPNVKVQGCMFGLVSDVLQHTPPSSSSSTSNVVFHDLAHFPQQQTEQSSQNSVTGTPHRGRQQHVDAFYGAPEAPSNQSATNTSTTSTSADPLGAFKLGLFGTHDTTW